ncbi:hypothetical protein V6N13_082603 [Hibiscus sabdariffa]
MTSVQEEVSALAVAQRWSEWLQLHDVDKDDSGAVEIHYWTWMSSTSSCKGVDPESSKEYREEQSMDQKDNNTYLGTGTADREVGAIL